MKLNLNDLTKAVSAVAGIANENALMKADMGQAQEAIDALTASLIAAATSPAGAVGLAAVSAALEPSEPVSAPVRPVLTDDGLAALKLDPVNGAPVE